MANKLPKYTDDELDQMYHMDSFAKDEADEDMKIINVLFVLGGIILGGLILTGLLSVTMIESIGATEGKHTGVITAIEYNSNIIYKSNLIYFKSDAQSTQEDIYCVNNNSLKNDLELFSKAGTKVTVTFENNLIMFKWQCQGGSSIITSVETEREREDI